MDFGGALRALKAGHRARRTGWNGKGMWIALTPGSVISRDLARAGAALKLEAELRAREARGEEAPGTLTIGAHVDLLAADGSLVIGWTASQTDMLAEDWELVS